MSDDGFAAALAAVLAHEGGYQAMPDDPGNWTGGKIGAGALKGTKFGITAASYPALDIASLTQVDAAAIYRRDFWDRWGFARLPPPLAAKLFDAAVNLGVGPAVQALQRALRAAGAPSAAARVAEDGMRPSACCRRSARRLPAITASSQRAIPRRRGSSPAGSPALIRELELSDAIVEREFQRGSDLDHRIQAARLLPVSISVK
jgi:hypothetical protein